MILCDRQGANIKPKNTPDPYTPRPKEGPNRFWIALNEALFGPYVDIGLSMKQNRACPGAALRATARKTLGCGAGWACFSCIYIYMYIHSV